MAESFFKRLSKKHRAASAGIDMSNYEKKKNIRDLSRITAECMEEIGIDVGRKKPKKLTKKMVDNADIVVLVGEDFEFPNYVRDAKRLIAWNIPDPVERSKDFFRETRDEIEKRVIGLIKELEEE